MNALGAGTASVGVATQGSQFVNAGMRVAG